MALPVEGDLVLGQWPARIQASKTRLKVLEMEVEMGCKLETEMGKEYG